MDMEMVQYHPTTLAGSGFLMTEAARGEGAYLLNSRGRALHEDATRPTRWSLPRATSRRAPKRRRSPKAAASTATCLLDLRHLGPDVILQEASADSRDGARLSRHRHDQGAGSGSSRHALSDGRHQDRRRRRDARARPLRGRRSRVRERSRRQSPRRQLAARHDRLRPAFGQGRRPRTRRARRRAPAARTCCAASKNACANCWRVRTPARRMPGLRLELATMMDEKVGLYRDDAGLQEALDKLQGIQASATRRSRSATKDASSIKRLTFALELGLSCSTAARRSFAARSYARRAAARIRVPTIPSATTRSGSSTSCLTRRGDARTRNLVRSRHDHSMEARGTHLLMQFTIEVGRYNPEGTYADNAVPGRAVSAAVGPLAGSPLSDVHGRASGARRRARRAHRDPRIPRSVARRALRVPQRDLRIVRDVDQRARASGLQEQARRVHAGRKDARRVAAVDADHSRSGLRHETVLG